MIHRRTFLKQAAAAGGLSALAEFGFLDLLPRVSAAEAKLVPDAVRFHPDIEPLVRLLEDTPRDRVLEEVAAKVRRGTSYREILAALQLAGVRNIQPRPVGFKFHAVLVVNSAHLASLASPDADRWLPIFWAIDQFKSSQAADVKEGDWTLRGIEESKIPDSRHAKQALIEALDRWDEPATDAAIVGLARTASAHEIFEILCRYGVRDFREIGHKAIYIANSFRTLETIGWHHAEPVLRSLAYGLLDTAGDKGNPSKADLSADRPFRRNVEAIKSIREGWLDGKPDAGASSELLETFRTGSSDDASSLAIQLLNRGVAPSSIFDALLNGAGELLIRAPGILSLHATTFTNAVHYAWRHCRDEEVRKLLLVQNAAFIPLFRGEPKRRVKIDELEPVALRETGAGAMDEIFADMADDRLRAAGKILGWLRENPDPKPYADAARRMIFMKGRDSHDYKFSSAVLEDHEHLRGPWRDRFLAASAFYFRGAGDADNDLVKRIRGALAG